MSDHEKFRVLLIDDDDFLIDMYAIKVSSAGHTVDTASNGPEAVSIVSNATEPYDAVLLDLVLPGMDGFEILQNIQGINSLKNAALIVLSNQSRPRDIDKARDMSADGYIVKASATPQQVLEEIEKIIINKKAK